MDHEREKRGDQAVGTSLGPRPGIADGKGFPRRARQHAPTIFRSQRSISAIPSGRVADSFQTHQNTSSIATSAAAASPGNARLTKRKRRGA